MGQAKNPIPVKLFIGILSNKAGLFIKAERLLSSKFGEADFKSGIIKFNFTKYYEKEMGRPLLRQFISLTRLVDPADLAGIKLFTNRIEKKLIKLDGRRNINLDPGYITESALILATTKAFQHRIYLNKGIYAEVTLKFTKGRFQPYEWTYPDYRTGKYCAFFNRMRNLYREQIKNKWKKQKNTGA